MSPFLSRPLFYGPMLLLALALPVSVACGALSWHLAEKHFLRRRRKPHPPAQQARVEMGEPATTT